MTQDYCRDKVRAKEAYYISTHTQAGSVPWWGQRVMGWRWWGSA